MINISSEEQVILERLGDLLKEARLARNESQEIFAGRLGLTRQSYSKMEKGNSSVPVGYWLLASSILGRLPTWENVLQGQQDLFSRYDQKLSGRKKAGKRNRGKA